MTGLMAGHGYWQGGYGVYVAVALSLLALVAGYFACAKAQCMECQRCKKIGKVVGWLVMIVAILQLICLAYRCYQSCGSDGKQCPLHGGVHEHGAEHGGQPMGDEPHE